jgi:16S rRNA (guanine527-N7)-methyltransferase
MFHVKHGETDSFEKFAKILKEYLCLDLSLKSQEKFRHYLDELLSWNKRINLISRKKDKSEYVYRHFLDSLLIYKAVRIPESAKVLDLGSGAGFPAIPVKIIREDLNITMVESIRKKVLFLKKVIELLELKDTTVLQKRTEEIQDQLEFKESFDFVTAKAFGKLKQTIYSAYPFLKQNGILVAYKGSSYRSEIIDFLKEPKNLQLQIKDIKFFAIPEFEIERFLVLIEKTS